MSCENIRKVYIVGMGMGSLNLLTKDAEKVLDGCDAYVGAKRVLEIWKEYDKKPSLDSYVTAEILDFIDACPAGSAIAVLYSGDVGFYSGAKNLLNRIRERELNGVTDSDISKAIKYEVRVIPGIASPIYFMDKLGTSWEDAVLVSNHGKYVNLIPLIRDNSKVCTLLGTRYAVSDICKKLVYYGLEDIDVTVGENLSYSHERIVSGKPSDFCNAEFDSLSVAFFFNKAPASMRLAAGIPDGAFIRDTEEEKHKIPMTKEEVREIVISKLHLSPSAVIYDIGAGTGSVSVETALLAREGWVYSVEMKQEAISLLEKNKKKFIVDNMEIISGKAPDVLKELPAPTHVFIGGSSGNLQEIICAVREKNPSARVVVTAITLETVAAISGIADKYPEYQNSFELVQINVSRGRTVGAYHILSAENPVYIAAFGGK